MSSAWPGASRVRQLPFRRLFTPLKRLVPHDADIVTAYTDGQVTLRSNRTKTGYHEAANLSGYQGVAPGDFVVHGLDILRGSVGVSDSSGAMSAVCTVCKPGPLVEPRFVAHAIRAQAESGYTKAMARGIREGGADFRRWATLAELPVPVPSLEYQKKALAFLDREIAQIDELIAEQQRLIEMLQERRSAVSTEALTSIDSVTEGKRLKHVVAGVKQGWSPQCYPWPADGIETWAVLKAGAANGGRFRPYENKELPESQTPRPDRVVQQGQLVVSRANTRDLVGSAAVVEGVFPRLMLSDKLYAFDIDQKQAHPSYVAAILGAPRARGMIELEATGSSPSMQNISQDDILNLSMDLPALNVQLQIISGIREQTVKIDTLITESERLIELSQERRSALIAAAVTGQIDVRQEA